MKTINFNQLICVFVVLILCSGCWSKKTPEPLSNAERSKYVAQLSNEIIDEFKKEAERQPDKDDLATEIHNISSLPESERDLRYSVLARQLIDTKQNKDALFVARKIKESVIKDTVLCEVVYAKIKSKRSVDDKVSRDIQPQPNLQNATSSNSESESESESNSGAGLELQPDASLTSSSPDRSESRLESRLGSDLEEPFLLSDVVDIIRDIRDPLLSAKLSIEVMSMLCDSFVAADWVGVMTDVAVGIRVSSVGGSRKAKALQLLANWFLNNGQKDKSLELCVDLELAVERVADSFECSLLMIDLSTLYMFLDADSAAERVCEEAATHVLKIDHETDRSTAIMKLAETTSIVLMRNLKQQDAKKLSRLKKLILSVDPIIEKHDTYKINSIDKQQNNSEKNTPTNSTSNNTNNTDTSSPDNEEYKTNIFWEQIRTTRDIQLRNLVRLQVWNVSDSDVMLDEVWDTIFDIESDRVRDEAMISAVDMMSITGSLEEAKEWAKRITNEDKKTEIIKKIDEKIESQKRLLPR